MYFTNNKWGNIVLLISEERLLFGLIMCIPGLLETVW